MGRDRGGAPADRRGAHGDRGRRRGHDRGRRGGGARGRARTSGAAPRDQRHRRDPAHQPRPRAARRRGACRDRCDRGGLRERRVRSRARLARLASRSPARPAARSDRRRGRGRGQQQCRGDGARPGGARPGSRDRGVAWRADRDRRLVPVTRDPRAVARRAGRGRHDQQDPRARLRAGDRSGDRTLAEGPSVELRDRRVHRRGHAGPGGRDRPRARDRDDDRPRLGHGDRA